jgi:hypothetical protein
MVFQSRWVGVVGLLVACTPEPTPSGHPVQLGPEIVCTAESSGAAFKEQAAAHGIVRRVGVALDRAFPLDVGVAAVDADQDGDVDLFLAVESGFPQVLENAGDGTFSEVPQSVALSALESETLLGFGLMDFDGDGLPDLLLFGPRAVAVAQNQGRLEFGQLRTVFVDTTAEVGLALSAAFGDADQDGDLDLFLPGLDPVGFEAPTEIGLRPSLDRFLIREGESYHLGPFFKNQAGPGLSMLGMFTDREGDGDPDLLVPSLRGAFGMTPTSFYRNTSAQEIGFLFEEDAAAVHADLAFSGMGMDSADLNGDGQQDYCMSDLNRIQCLLSSDAGTFSESARALGLRLPTQQEGEGWSGWSLDLVDLNNDAVLDLVVAGGAPMNQVGDGLDYSGAQNQLWWGENGGFELAPEQPFSNSVDHFGMVVADFDKNGSRDVLFSGPGGEVRAYFNSCSTTAWAEISLAGPEGNAQGLGARVFLRANELRHARQIQGLRGLAQGPAQAHFGLGEAESIGKLTVVWPDGEITISKDLPVNRALRVPHPSRLVGEGETGFFANHEGVP